MVTLQPSGIVDHVIQTDNNTLRSIIKGELGGSRKVEIEEIDRFLSIVGKYHSKAGGSASNVVRTLASLGASTKLVGARGNDPPGEIFHNSLQTSNVNVDDLSVKEGMTGRCCIFTSNGERTMRTSLGTAQLVATELSASHISEANTVFLSSCA